jgi:hypothetical protein
MDPGLVAFRAELYQDVLRAADADGILVEDAFFALAAEYAVDSGEIPTADRALYTNRGLRVDGYGGPPEDADGALIILVADFAQVEEPPTLTANEMEAHFRRALAFIEKSLDSTFRRGLEETSAGFGLADMISESWDRISRIKLVLLTNRALSRRVDGLPAGDMLDRPVTHGVWDAERLYRFASSGREREDLVIDMAEHGGPLAALPAALGDADYEAFLVVLPGTQLASIYDRWGTRLLEQNVRVFLQARGAVNRGIKSTLDADPGMFFAYNNGLTATAERIESENVKGAVQIVRLHNLQIVNGGQTTASVFAASKRDSVDLDRVFVQMKLSVIQPERAKEVVPKISEFANSQNKVNAADFFANHPFHVRIKQFSTVIYAPSVDGSFRQSKWFYERARGEYQDARSGLSASERKKFDLEYPRTQIFTKTDLAKYLSVWEGLPHIVSKGAQTNFAKFAERTGQAWESEADRFNERFFRECIAKAIVFRETERLVSAASWYSGSYRANIVAYAISKVAHDVELRQRSLNFESIWQAQGISKDLTVALSLAAEASLRIITSPPAGAVKNVTEWAKRPGAWTALQAVELTWSPSFLESLLSRAEARTEARQATKEQRVLNGIQAQVAVMQAGPEYFARAHDWAVTNRLLSVRELETLAIVRRPTKSLPNEKQSLIVVEAISKLRKAGFPEALPEPRNA